MKKIRVLTGIIFAIITIVTIFVIINIRADKLNDKSEVRVCNQVRNIKEIISTISEKNINDLAIEEYSELKLRKIRKLKLNLEELDQKYRIKSIKKNGDFRPIKYRVVYQSKKMYLFLYYDENGKYSGSEVFKKSPIKSTFDFVKINKTKLSEVYKFDKNGLYSFKNPPWPINSSGHFTSDGYLLTFIYDEDDIIREIRTELI